MKLHNWLIPALAGCLAVSVAGCSDDAGAGGSSGEKEYVIGSITSLSGPLTPATEPWKQAQDIWEMENTEINGVPVRVVTCDDESTPQGASVCARKLLDQDNADIIVGPNIGVTFSGAEPILARAPLSINVSPYAKPSEGAPIVSVAASAQSYTQAALEFAADQGWTNIGVLATTDATGQIGVDEQGAIAEELGLNLDTQRVDLTDTSATTQMSRLASGDPDAIVIWMTGRPAGVALQAIRELELSETPLIMLQSNLSAGFLGSVAELLYEQVYVCAYSSLDVPGIEDADQRVRMESFVQKYEEEFGQAPDGVGRLSLDAFHLASRTLEETEGNRDEFMNYVNGLESFPLYNMSATFGEEDTFAADADQLSIFRLTDGQAVPFES